MALSFTMPRRSAVLAGAAVALSPPQRTPASSPPTPTITLADGTNLPCATFGVQIYDDRTARELTLRAISAGFRSFFTSPEGGNQRGFSQGVLESGIPRSELFIAGTVLSDDAVGFRTAKATTARRCEASFEALASGGGVDKLDMLLLERPGLDGASIRGQWNALEAAQATGAAQSLGVCNFEVEQLDECLKGARTAKPQLNQLQYTLAIRMAHESVRRAHLDRGVRLMAFSPLGGPSALIPRATLDECKRIGKRYRKSPYQVALRWLVQQGVAYSVHSRDVAHLREDLDVYGFALAPEEMRRLEVLSESAPAYY